MKTADFELYQKLLYRESGLVITPEKSYLLDSRLSPVAKKWKLDGGLLALTEALRRPAPDPQMIKDVMEAMTTNETSFFRDMKPFQIMESVVLPYLAKKKPGGTVRIWCAAASSGQEPYSIAMTIKENQAKLGGLRFDILATDISTDILDIAKRARYSQFEVQRGMPISQLLKYFAQDGEIWALKDEVRSMVRFDYLNLLKPFPMAGNFDIVFCRNVLIYFDQPTKTDVLNRIYQKTEKDGFLFLGGAETVLGLTDKFKPLEGQRGLYVPQDSTYQPV